MSLFMYCVIAVLIAFVIGRANRSIKLFWELLIAFGVGAMGAAIVKKCSAPDNEKANVVTVLTPESGLPASIPFFSEMSELDALPAPTTTFVVAQVGQDVVRDNNVLLLNAASEASGEPRGQPFLEGFYNTS